MAGILIHACLILNIEKIDACINCKTDICVKTAYIVDVIARNDIYSWKLFVIVTSR